MARWNNPYGSDIILGTTSGEIIVRVREDSDLRVHLRATSGRVTSAFAELDTDRAGSTHQVSGTLRSGSGQLTAGAVSGNVSLLRRPVEAEETGTAGAAEGGGTR